ncbi:MAG: hypothetical protein BWZ07_03252 [Alphaproteobacteria bacterium ADurb.BinA280]|nr:MAG: hypothetical protein BWZ07_03252 [Alphaproteobacteria bacterium ADurb.BinA280]
MGAPLGRQATQCAVQETREGLASTQWSQTVCHVVIPCRNKSAVWDDDAILCDLMKYPG